MKRRLRISHLLPTGTSLEFYSAATLGYFYGKGRMTQRAEPRAQSQGVIENDSQGVGLNWAIIKKVALAYTRSKVADRRGREKEHRKGNMDNITSFI